MSNWRIDILRILIDADERVSFDNPNDQRILNALVFQGLVDRLEFAPGLFSYEITHAGHVYYKQYKGTYRRPPRHHHDWPWRKVVESQFDTGGQASFARGGMPLGSSWTLRLECGHSVVRPVKYKPADQCEDPYVGSEGRRPLGTRCGWYIRRNPEDALPAPKKVRCHMCRGE